MNSKPTCPVRRRARTLKVRNVLASLAVFAGGTLPVLGASVAQVDVQPAHVVRITKAVQPVVQHLESAPKAPAPMTQPVAPKAEPTLVRTAAKVVTGQLVGMGEASFYGKGDGFAGRKTANGEVFDPSMMTAAHKTLPLGTRLKVTNLGNQKSIVVRVNDRGPYAKGRVLDLSYGAAQRLGMVQSGHAKVRLERLG